MAYKEQMKEWLSKHPNATPEEAYKAGYWQSNSNWCHGKVDLMKEVREKLKQLLE